VAIFDFATGRFWPQDAWQILPATFWTFTACGGVAITVLQFVEGMKRRRLEKFSGTLPTLPIYFLLGSLAAWQAAVELWRRPFHWEKTEHDETAPRKNVFKRSFKDIWRVPARPRPAAAQY
jgi:hypothetical protein